MKLAFLFLLCRRFKYSMTEGWMKGDPMWEEERTSSRVRELMGSL